MTNKFGTAVLVSLVTSYSTACFAADDDTAKYTFSGFGTFGATRSSEHLADYTASVSQPNGPGFSRKWSIDTDTRLAGQLTANFNDQWSAVLQVVAEQRSDNSYTPKVEWANVQYMVTPDLSIRVGRIALPTLLMSNVRQVGYALPWVRVPYTFYAGLPLASADGVDASYKFRSGSIKHTVTVHAGTRILTPGSGPLARVDLRAKNLWGIVDSMTYGALTLQLSHAQARIKLGDVRLPVKQNSVGFTYDPGEWFVTGEWSKNTYAPSSNPKIWYIGGGYRVGQFTPYVSYSDRTTSDSTAPSVSPPLKTEALGLRWDFMKNVDLKLQYDRNALKAGSFGDLINLQPGFKPGGTFHVISANIDFVF